MHQHNRIFVGSSKTINELSESPKNHFDLHLAKYMFLKSCRAQKCDPFTAFLKLAGQTYCLTADVVQTVDLDTAHNDYDSEDYSDEDII